MPIISSTYKAPWYLINRHINTIQPALFRKVTGVHYHRERIETKDGDFIDIDWSANERKQLIILFHGLEGSSQRPYMKGMVRIFNHNNWDAVAVNFRGCSGEPNRLLTSYHMGASHHVDEVIQHITTHYDYESIVVFGVSLGGNVVLKYLGEKGTELPAIIKAGIALSVPTDIVSANRQFEKWYNRHYVLNFMLTLNQKAKQKAEQFPDQISLPSKTPLTFAAYDGTFTAPIHGFKDAVDYWTKCSANNFIPHIQCPTLLVNALDDTFLGKECYPYQLAQENKNFFLETPKGGGHAAFAGEDKNGYLWSEKRALEFVKEWV